MVVPKSAYPPSQFHHNLTKSLSPSAAQDLLAAFLDQTETCPYLHPDALLSPHGITYAAQSGPTGGLAIHHLKRISAGLRGENLAVESAAELAQFDTLASAEVLNQTTKAQDSAHHGGDGQYNELPAGDDSRLDAFIAEAHDSRYDARGKKSLAEISEWAEAASNDAAFEREGQDLEEYEHAQRPLEGDVGDRDGAPVVRQNGRVPEIVHEESAGHKRPLTDAEKASRKAAKKAKKKAERAEKHR